MPNRNKSNKNPKKTIIIALSSIVAVVVVVSVAATLVDSMFFKGALVPLTTTTLDKTTVEPRDLADSTIVEIKEVCGDGILQGSEACDDGNTYDRDNCRADCTWGVCGDGVTKTLTNPVVEECDDGDGNDNSRACSTTCRTQEKIIVTYKDKIGTEDIWDITHEPVYDSWYGLVFEVATFGLENDDIYISDITFNTDRNRACAGEADCIAMDAPWYSKLVFANVATTVSPTKESSIESSVTTINTLAEHQEREECRLGPDNSRLRFDSTDIDGQEVLVASNEPITFALFADAGYDRTVCNPGGRSFGDDAFFFLYQYPGFAIFEAPTYIREMIDQGIISTDSLIDYDLAQTAPFIRDIEFTTTDGLRTFTLQNNPDVVEISNARELGVTSFMLQPSSFYLSK